MNEGFCIEYRHLERGLLHHIKEVKRVRARKDYRKVPTHEPQLCILYIVSCIVVKRGAGSHNRTAPAGPLLAGFESRLPLIESSLAFIPFLPASAPHPLRGGSDPLRF